MAHAADSFTECLWALESKNFQRHPKGEVPVGVKTNDGIEEGASLIGKIRHEIESYDLMVVLTPSNRIVGCKRSDLYFPNP